MKNKQVNLKANYLPIQQAYPFVLDRLPEYRQAGISYRILRNSILRKGFDRIG